MLKEEVCIFSWWVGNCRYCDNHLIPADHTHTYS